jgi:hypothetical protein
VWLVVIPIITFSLLILVRPSLLEGVTNVTILLPLPISLVPLTLVLVSTIGIWRREAWGVLLYGAAGLLGVGIMVFHPDAGPLPAEAFETPLFRIGVAALTIIYTWTLWTHLYDEVA